MAMGKRRKDRQESLFVATDRLPKAAGHPFYERLNQLLTAGAHQPSDSSHRSERRVVGAKRSVPL